MIVEDNTDRFEKKISEAIQQGLESCAMTMESYAKKSCPVDTGRLRNSITHQMDEEGMQVEVGSYVEYAPYVECGTIHMSSHPFLRPAATRHDMEYEEIFTRCFQ